MRPKEASYSVYFRPDEGLRLETGLSRREFAEQLRIPRSSYFHLMTTAANPSLNYIELIAERGGRRSFDVVAAACQRRQRTSWRHAGPPLGQVSRFKDLSVKYSNVQYTGPRVSCMFSVVFLPWTRKPVNDAACSQAAARRSFDSE
jgi:hypothetical protein